MEKMTLVILAAGMGSRFGGLKQIEPVGRHGEIIADYSVYDAARAGFSKVVFVIKHEIDSVFRETVFNRINKIIDAEIVYQELDMLPNGILPPSERKKPWGTGHAVMCAKNAVDGPFAVINADDFYGASAFSDIYRYMSSPVKSGKYQFCMSGYLLKNTVSEAGHVSRGVCTINEKGYLTGIKETTHIQKHKDGLITYTLDGYNHYPIEPDTIVSMNAWGFQQEFFTEAEKYFISFMDKNKSNMNSAEYYLPSVVEELLLESKAEVKVLPSKDTWYGFTYKEDKAIVKEAVNDMIGKGIYPERLF